MPPVSIENPILNSPFAEPTRHFRFDEDGIRSGIAEGRRRSTYFIPIAKSKTNGGAQRSLIAFKMATGSDKTVVMAMLIAWHALNKRSDPHAERFANGRSGSASRRAAVPRDQVRPTDKLTA